VPLLAKKGEQNVWHFAHDGNPCSTGAETAIHQMAKQILAQEKVIRLPAVVVSLSAVDAFDRTRTVTGTLAKAQLVRYDAVELEATRDNRRPDAVGLAEEGIEHRIEVFVRHAVDAAKTADMDRNGCICYEICLNDMSTLTTIEQLRSAVLSSPDRIRWVSYPGMTDLRNHLQHKLDRIIQTSVRQKRDDDAQIARAYAEQVHAAPAEHRGWARRQREISRADERLTRANRKFAQSDEQTKRSYLWAKLKLGVGDTPSLINQPVKYDNAFGVSRDIWQADMFRRFVFGERKQRIVLERVLAWAEQRYPIDGTNSDQKKVATWQYFKSLEHMGYVRHLERDQFHVDNDIAPWLVDALSVTGSWSWSAGAGTCSLGELHKANDVIGSNLSTGQLMEVYRWMRSEYESRGKVVCIVQTISQRLDIRPSILLSLFSSADAATAIRKPELIRT
jgi:hypothetical protein